MADRPFILKGNSELIFPVTPGSYKVDTGINVELINIHELGDVHLAGYGTLSTITIEALFPANAYSFSSGANPEYYIEQIKNMIAQKTPVRFIVGGTGVNISVLVQSVTYGEEDGTNDVYATIILKEHRPLVVVQVAQPQESKRREPVRQQEGEQAYTTKKNDTLSSISRKFYGNSVTENMNKIAQYNKISRVQLASGTHNIKIPTGMSGRVATRE